MLLFITLYLLCGVAFLTRCIVKSEGFDLSGGFVPNWMMYSSGLFFWWYWIIFMWRDK